MHGNSPTTYDDIVEEISERMDLPSEVIGVGWFGLVRWFGLVSRLVGWLVG